MRKRMSKVKRPEGKRLSKSGMRLGNVDQAQTGAGNVLTGGSKMGHPRRHRY